MIKAILYDLDGVLVDATEWHYESLNEALKEISGFEISRLEHIQTFNGLPTQIFFHIFPPLWMHINLGKRREQMDGSRLEKFRNECSGGGFLCPGIFSTLLHPRG